MENLSKDIANLKMVYMALERIQSYTSHVKKTDYDLKTVDAVIRCLIVISASCANISEEFKKIWDDIRWTVLLNCALMAQIQENQIWTIIRHRSIGILKNTPLILEILVKYNNLPAKDEMVTTGFSLSKLVRFANEKGAVLVQFLIDEINRKEKTDINLKDINIQNIVEMMKKHDELQNSNIDDHPKRYFFLKEGYNNKRLNFYLSDLILCIEFMAKMKKTEMIDQYLSNKLKHNLMTKTV